MKTYFVWLINAHLALCLITVVVVVFFFLGGGGTMLMPLGENKKVVSRHHVLTIMLFCFNLLAALASCLFPGVPPLDSPLENTTGSCQIRTTKGVITEG